MSNPSAPPDSQVMPGEKTPSAEIVKATASSPYVLERMPLMTDDEIRRTWRLAGALAQSNMFKNAVQAEQAFAKILVGRDLGLTPTQALTGLHFVEGKIEIAAVMMATFIRRRDGYDFRQAWIKQTGPARAGAPTVREAVYVDEDVATDLREVVGCAIEFTVEGQVRGVSSWTIEDSERAGLTKPRGSAPSNHVRYPRNMFFARAMSNGCKWLVPEVLAGIPVYVEGEIEAQKAIGEGDGEGRVQGLDLGPDVEKIIARASELGHAALADRGSIEMTLGNQPPSTVVAWVQAAKRELDALPTDAEVVDVPGPAETLPIVEHEAEHEPAVPPDLSHGYSDAFLDDGPDGPPRRAEPRDPEAVEKMRVQALELLDFADSLDAEGNATAAEQARAEASDLMAEVDAAGDPAQDRMAL